MARLIPAFLTTPPSIRPLVRPRAAVLLALIAALGSCLWSCSHSVPYHLQEIGGLMPRLQFELTDDDARPVTAATYRGDVVLMYFGYTHCPDVCPTTLASLGAALGRLGADASKVKVLFVTVDPARDSAALLKRYVGYFGPQFVGLRGDDDALRPLIRRYRIAYHRDPPDAHGNYAVEHSSIVFVFDEQGRARLLARDSDSPENVAADLRRLIHSG